MTTTQKIYQAIEFFSGEEPHYGRFKTTFAGALVDHGVPADNAGQMARVAAESLRDREGADHHLGVAQVIAQDAEFERAMGGNPEAFQAMHRYMSYYLEYAESWQASAAS